MSGSAPVGWPGAGRLTCHGCVAQEAGNFLLAELLLLISQQLVDELPKHLLGRCVQHGVDIDDERVDVPGGGCRSKGFLTPGLTLGSGVGWGWIRGALLGHRFQAHALSPLPTSKTEKGTGREVLWPGCPDSNPASATYQPSDLFLKLLNFAVPQFPHL